MATAPQNRYIGSTNDALPEDLQDFDNELRELRAQDAERITRQVTLRDVMAQFRRDATVFQSSITDYGRKLVQEASGSGKHDLRLPYMLAIAIKHTHRAAAKVPDVRVERGDQSLEERFRQYAIERYLAACWGHTDAAVQIQDGAWDAATTGATAYEVQYDVGKQIGCFYSRDPAGLVVVPDPVTVWPYQRVYRSWSTPMAALKAAYKGHTINPLDEQYGNVAVEALIPDEGGDPAGWRCTVHEVSTPELKLRWSGSVELHRHEHGYGICPWVIHPNIGPRRSLWGYADLELILDAALYYQALLSDQADVVAFSARGVYTDMGTGQPAAAIRSTLKTGGVIPIREGSELKPLEIVQQPAFIDQHVDDARKAISELGFAPFPTWASEPTAQATSGAERGMGMQPAMELAQMKQGNMAWGLQRVNEVILRIAEQKIHPDDGLTYRGHLRKSNGVPVPFTAKLGGARGGDELPQEFQDLPQTDLPYAIDGDYQTSITFTDRLDMYDPAFVMSELSKFQQGAQSLRTTLENTGCQDPDNEIALIAAEAEDYPWMRQGMIALITAQLEQQANGQNGPQLPPAPDETAGYGPMSGLAAGGLDGSVPGAVSDMTSRSLNGSADTGRPKNGNGASPNGSAPAAQVGGGAY